MEYNFKVGDLVTWIPDGDLGVVTKVDKYVLEDEAASGPILDAGRFEYEPFWIQWIKDPGATGWHSRDNMLKLLNPA